MPVNFNTYRGEKSVVALADRLYDLRKAKPALRKRVEEELLRSNPQLRHLAGLPKGAALIVPDLAQVTPAEDTVSVTSLLAGSFVQLAQGLDEARNAATAFLARQEEEAHQTLEVLRGPEFSKLARAEPAVKARIAEARVKLNARVKASAARKAAHEEAFDDLERRLGEFHRTFGER